MTKWVFHIGGQHIEVNSIPYDKPLTGKTYHKNGHTHIVGPKGALYSSIVRNHSQNFYVSRLRHRETEMLRAFVRLGALSSKATLAVVRTEERRQKRSADRDAAQWVLEQGPKLDGFVFTKEQFAFLTKKAKPEPKPKKEA